MLLGRTWDVSAQRQWPASAFLYLETALMCSWRQLQQWHQETAALCSEASWCEAEFSCPVVGP